MHMVVTEPQFHGVGGGGVAQLDCNGKSSHRNTVANVTVTAWAGRQ